MATALSSRRKLEYTIKTTWDGNSISEEEHVTLGLEGDGISGDVTIQIDSPFYDDPAPDAPPGEPLFRLWDYEVVELFFLNEKQQYLEVEVGPHGQHIVLFLNGKRNIVKHSLPLQVTTNIEGSRWVGEALIPGDYFPPQVTKFNAYAMHGPEPDRKYLSLYPTDGVTPGPEFHNLRFFQRIAMTTLGSVHDDVTEFSPLWRSALNK